MSPKTPRAPLARHGRLRSPHPIAQIATIIGAALAVVVLGVAGTAAFAAWNATDLVHENAITLESSKPLPPTIGEIEGGVNLLLVGTDSCEGQDLTLFPRCAHDDGGERNDVTMLIHIGDNPRRVTVVSFPRDMIVPIPSCPSADGGRYSAMSAQMLNVSYSYGGLACTALTIQQLTGVDIQFAAAIRWTGVINMSDAIGGVKVCVAGDISDRNTGLHLTAGEHTLKGAQALQFLRIRHGIGDGSDLSRISNQQQFMSSLVRKLQSGGVLGDPTKLFALATTALQQVSDKQLVLDENLSNPTRMVQIAMALKSVPYNDIVFVQYPTSYDPANASRVLPIYESAQTLFTALKENKSLNLTGKASPADGVEITEDGTPSASASPSPDSDAVDLPSSITGTTAAQTTCTVPDHQ
ncbi:LytR family transcriptional regulator [Microbacterium protaetiae]|uniref:LytR family transcriptional regulator n=1 Tax=Microbacterium protaetiae TaxID=2509458 RepID=A0A4P6ERG1_9MICO|nr:LCP family protein [Microbacterium protaetiae]QAY60498.1 LytR family transcriptional regulator [Microbacterium protaetiae]